MEIGRIDLKSDTWIIRVDHGSFHDDFWPVNLPEKFHVKGQEVVFEGALGRIPINVKLAGTPVRLRMIRNLYRIQPGNSGGETNPGEKELTETKSTDTLVTLQKAAGKIVLISDNWLIEQNVNGEIKRYVPDFLPEDFRVVNTEITFSGIVKKPDPNVRMMGTPIQITELMAVENVSFDASSLQEPVKEFYPFDSVGYLTPVKGIIKKMSADPNVYIIETDNGNNSVSRYLPATLPDAFKKEGLAVIVSGTIGKIPANVRMMGTPLTLDEIKISN